MVGSQSEEGNSESKERHSESERSLNVSYSYSDDELDSNSVVEPYSFESWYVDGTGSHQPDEDSLEASQSNGHDRTSNLQR